MIKDFLSAVWDGHEGFGEIRTLVHGAGTMEQSFARIPERLDLLVEWAQSFNAAGRDVYYGVLPRLTPDSGKSDNCVTTTRVLWADVDAKRTSGKYAALASTRAGKQLPSIIVDSGHGYHAYWLLREQTTFDLAQRAMKALAREVHGDAVSDQARILRIPGTMNRKDPAHPVQVRVVYLDLSRLHRISDFDIEPPDQTWRGSHEARQGTPRMDHAVPSWLLEKLQSSPPHGARSEAVFSAVLWLCRYGWTDDLIVDAIAGGPLGEKYHEKGRDGPRWLESTIKAARKAAEE